MLAIKARGEGLEPLLLSGRDPVALRNRGAPPSTLSALV